MFYQYILFSCSFLKPSNTCPNCHLLWLYIEITGSRGNNGPTGIPSTFYPSEAPTSTEAARSIPLLWGVQLTNHFQLSHLQDPQQCSHQDHTCPTHRGMLEEDHSCPTEGISNGQNLLGLPTPSPHHWYGWDFLKAVLLPETLPPPSFFILSYTDVRPTYTWLPLLYLPMPNTMLGKCSANNCLKNPCQAYISYYNWSPRPEIHIFNHLLNIFNQ